MLYVMIGIPGPVHKYCAYRLTLQFSVWCASRFSRFIFIAIKLVIVNLFVLCVLFYLLNKFMFHSTWTCLLFCHIKIKHISLLNEMLIRLLKFTKRIYLSGLFCYCFRIWKIIIGKSKQKTLKLISLNAIYSIECSWKIESTVS